MSHVRFVVTDSDLRYTVRFSRSTLEEAILPLADGLERGYVESAERPFCTAVAGPPGSGKSTFARVIAQLLTERGVPATVLPLDGFHFPNEILKQKKSQVDGREVKLIDIKGGPETYDTDLLRDKLNRLCLGERLWWPVYSRKTHQPVVQGIKVETTCCLYLIEGNYLLLDREPWRDMARLFHRTVFIKPLPDLLKRRVTARKMKGGYSRRQTLEHFKRSDSRNIAAVLACSAVRDYCLVQKGRYRYQLVRGEKPA